MIKGLDLLKWFGYFLWVFFIGGGGGVGIFLGFMIYMYILFDVLINYVEIRFKRFRVGIVFLIFELFLLFEGKGMVGVLLDVIIDKD